MIEQDLYATLAADTALAALVGSHIYPLTAPQGVKAPHAIFGVSGRSQDDTACDYASLVEKEIQIDCKAKNYFDARRVAAAVRSVLNKFSGSMGSTTVDRIMLVTEQDVYDEEPGLCVVSQTFSVSYQEE